MLRLARLVVVVTVSLFCVGCDQATKAMARNYLPRNEIQSFAYDTFRLQYAENTGAFLSPTFAIQPRKKANCLFLLEANLVGLHYTRGIIRWVGRRTVSWAGVVRGASGAVG